MLRVERARLVIAGILAVIASVASACELVLPLDGYAASTDAVATDTGAVDTGRDAARDARRADAPGPSDAEAGTTDAEEAGPGDSARPDAGDWCASQSPGYRICSDFDRSGGVTQGFDPAMVMNGTGGSFVLDGDASVSPPRSALGVAYPYPAHGTGGDLLVGTLWALGTTPKVTCTLEWMPLALSTAANDYAHILELSIYADTAETMPLEGLGINLRGDGTLIFLDYDEVGQTTAVSTPIPYTVTTGTWVAVKLSITPGALPRYEASVGGKLVSGVLPMLQATSFATLQVGPAYFGGATTSSSPGWTFDYDNVLCY